MEKNLQQNYINTDKKGLPTGHIRSLLTFLFILLGILLGVWVGVQAANQSVLTLSTSAQGLTQTDGNIKVRIRAVDASKVNKSLYTIDQTAKVDNGQLKLRWQVPEKAKKRAAYIEVCVVDQNSTSASASVKNACIRTSGSSKYNKVSCPYYVSANSAGIFGQLAGWNKLDDSQKVGCDSGQNFGNISSLKALSDSQFASLQIEGSGVLIAENGKIRAKSIEEFIKDVLSQVNSSNSATTTNVSTEANSSGTITNIATGVGLTGGPITNSGTIGLADTTVTAGVYGDSTVNVAQFTVDAQGRLTDVSNRSLPTADTSNTGVLSAADWTTFNGKENVLTFNGNGLFTRSGNTVTGLSCTSNQVPKWAGLVFACGSDVDTGITSIGTLDSQAKSANGAVVSGSTLYMQTADVTNPGLVSIGTQTFAGAKTFVDAVKFQNAINSTTAFQVQNAAGTSVLTVDTTNQRIGIGTALPGAKLEVAISGVGITSIFGRGLDANFKLNAYQGDTSNLTGGLIGQFGLTYGSTNNAAIRFHRGGSTVGGFISFTTDNDTEKVRFDTYGNVGIGTAGAISSLLQLGSDAGTVASGITFGSTGDTNLYRSAADTLKTDDRFTIQHHTFSPGVGNNSPALELQAGSSSGVLGNAQIAFGYGGSATYQHRIGSRHLSAAQSGNALDFYLWNFGVDAVGTYGTQHALTLDGTGRAGIGGVTAPTAALSLPDGTTADFGIAFGTDTKLFRSDVSTLSSDSLRLEGALTVGGSTIFNGSVALNGGLDLSINYGGKLIFSGDTNLYRSAANTLKTDDRLTVQHHTFNGAVGGNAPALELQAGSPSGVLGNAQIAFGYGGSASYQHRIGSRHEGGAQSGNALDFYLWNFGVDAVGTYGTKHALTLDGTGRIGIGGVTTPTAALSLPDGTTAAFGIAFGTDTNLYRSAANTLKTDDNFLVQTATNSTTAFQIQNAAGIALLGVDTTNGLIFSGVANGATATGFTFNTTNALTTAGAKIVSFQNATTEKFSIDKDGNIVTYGHIKSTQTTAPTIGTPTACGTTPSASVATGSTDSAGSFTVTAGTGSPGNCSALITFNSTYGAAPKTVILTSASSTGGSKNMYISTPTTTGFTAVMSTAPPASESNTYYYWVVE